MVKLRGSRTTKTAHCRDGLQCNSQGQILVPVDEPDLLKAIIKAHHDPPLRGHLGVDKSIDNVRRDFSWQNLNKDVKDYVRACDTCQRDKVSRLKPAGKLMPLSVPARRWGTVTLDFITDLPPTRDGHDKILVFVDKLTKMVHFAPTHKTISAVETARLYIDTLVKHHAFQENLVSDRDARFTGHF